MKKQYIVPMSITARINGEDELLKDFNLNGGSIGGENMGAKRRGEADDASDDDFWSTSSNNF